MRKHLKTPCASVSLWLVMRTSLRTWTLKMPHSAEMPWPRLFILAYLIGKPHSLWRVLKQHYSANEKYLIRLKIVANINIYPHFLSLVNGEIIHCFRLVNKINSSIGQDPDSKVLIGVLDIYGFESFKTNRCFPGTLLCCHQTTRTCPKPIRPYNSLHLTFLIFFAHCSPFKYEMSAIE